MSTAAVYIPDQQPPSVTAWKAGNATAITVNNSGREPAVQTWRDGQPVETTFNPERIQPQYQAQDELDRLRNYSTRLNLTNSGGFNPDQSNKPPNVAATSVATNESAQNSVNPKSTTSQQGLGSSEEKGHEPREGATYTEVKGDPQTHTVTLSTTTYRPAGGHLIEAVDTYTYRRPETTNGEYGNFPRRTHFEHEVDERGSEVFANGGKIVKNGDRVVPLGGPGSAEERPGLARHGNAL
ncbi:uncharacterized protein SPPG_03019 [Spizellomyces punctatus DAOM BR117]|uniref:Uncharacterized protein n=1 Tax=Spizellomyces punctatus (strain DAOM BR117) TaxID=645134 RepID=A0A0L0HMC7_SPIPD|nr:uncharacterized protein SPPG_03019 [Spizellomyces punctatus DAOM BR117]KND02561.1 hypothetical protein SPPG_03019 [Spizellomyces punctatus DAOM BR117]|eukprot:XP_016610600.1 hypothetical protein SPPG_03019 [Spizellomyces punctatus DAOM BR117]